MMTRKISHIKYQSIFNSTQNTVPLALAASNLCVLMLNRWLNVLFTFGSQTLASIYNNSSSSDQLVTNKIGGNFNISSFESSSFPFIIKQFKNKDMWMSLRWSVLMWHSLYGRLCQLTPCSCNTKHLARYGKIIGNLWNGWNQIYHYIALEAFCKFSHCNALISDNPRW